MVSHIPDLTKSQKNKIKLSLKIIVEICFFLSGKGSTGNFVIISLDFVVIYMTLILFTGDLVWIKNVTSLFKMLLVTTKLFQITQWETSNFAQ